MPRFLCSFLLLLPFLGYSQNFSTYHWEIHDTTNAPFPNNGMVDICFQDDGTTWVTTTYQRLYSYDGTTWTHHPKPADWEYHGWLNEIVITKQGKLWITGLVGQLVSYDPKTKTWERFDFPQGGQPWVIRQNKKGVLLIATSISQGKLYQFHKGEFTLIEDRYKDAFEILFDKKGDAYVGFRKGCYLYKMNSNGTYTYQNSSFQSKEAFYDLEFDSKGVLWGSSYSSMCLFSRKDDQWEKLVGAPDNICYDYNGTFKYIPHELVVLPDDRVLFATQFNASIAIYGDGVWETYNLPVSMQDGVGRLRLKDDLSVWCGTWKHGLYIFKPRELDTLPIEPPLPSVTYAPKNDGNAVAFTPDPTRTIQTAATHTTTAARVQIELTDYEQVDGDTISLYYNGALIVYRAALSKQPIVVTLDLQEGSNELLLFAHNLGRIPPNTAAIHILDGERRIRLDVDADYTVHGRVLFRRE